MNQNFDDEDDKNKSSEFAKLLEDSFKKTKKSVSVGDKIKSEILSIGKEEVFVSTGTLRDGSVPRKDLLDANGNFNFKVGDMVDLYVTQTKGSDIRLSPNPTAKNIAESLEDAFDMMLPVQGRVTEICKGGFRVSLSGKTAFCPISQMDNKKIENPETYIGQRFEFSITQFSERGRNIVVSRRRLLDEQKGLSEGAFLEQHRIGDIVEGKITRLEKFGALAQIAPGIDGLIHISELSWSRVNDPSEVVQVGQSFKLKLLSAEERDGRFRVSLSLKQVEGEPWTRLPEAVREGAVIDGRVIRCVKFGAFVELAPGLEGLIPLSEMSYTRRVVRSDELFKEGDTVSVMVKELRPGERRILLSLKDAGADPWAMVPQKYPQGAIVKGRVQRREPFGLFIELEEGVIGLLPKSKAIDVSHFNYEKMKVGDEAIVQVQELKVEERRMSLDVPQDPDQGEWKAFSNETAGSSFGTLGQQFQNFFKKKKNEKDE